MGRNATLITNSQSLAAMALVIGLLALPAILGRYRSNAETIQQLENRRQEAAPPLRLLFDDARQYVQNTEKFLKDTIGFRHRANALYRKTRYVVFNDPPLPNITVGKNGHLFLNGPRPDAPYHYMQLLCGTQGDPPAELLDRLETTFAAASRYFTDRGAKVVFAVVPSTLTLYADKLPLAVPSAYRRACLDYPQKDHALAQLGRRGESTGLYRVFYPYALFTAHKNDAYFYPKERYHCEGKSVYLFTRHLLKESGAVDRLLLDDPSTLTETRNDIGTFFGYALPPVEVWSYAYANRPTETQFARWLQKAFGGRWDLLIHSFTEASLTPNTALMIGNSFGTSVNPHLAKGFRQLYFLDTNNFTSEQNQAEIFAAVAERIRPDFVYFVFDDKNVTDLPQRLGAFVELEKRETNQRTSAPPSPKGSFLEKSGL